MKHKLKIAGIVVATLAIVSVCVAISINVYVKNTTAGRIISPDEAVRLQDVDCALVLGCQVRADGTPSTMLKDRLTRGIELYNMRAVPKLLMSGDNGSKDYDETNAMYRYAVDNKVPQVDVFRDYAGFSTYESVYRAKVIFQADKIVIITQKYHLYRALYIAKRLGIEAYGVASDYQQYRGQSIRDIREVLARCKDFVYAIFKPRPTYLGDVIPISGDGN